MNLENADWVPVPDEFFGPGFGVRFEVCPDGCVRSRSLGSISSGLDKRVYLPLILKGRVQYHLCWQRKNYYLDANAVLDFFDEPAISDDEAFIQEVTEAAGIENERRSEISKFRRAHRVKDFPRQTVFSLPHCPWERAQIHGPAMGADPVVGF